MASKSKNGTTAQSNQADPASPAGRRLRFLAEFLGGRTMPALSMGQTFVAFRHRNYRLWFFGQLVSLVGTWMQTAALGFLVFELTHSPAYLGYVGFASGLPSWVFMLYGGVVADRISRRKLMVLAQSCMMVLAFILAGLTFSGLIQPWQIIILTLALGVANAFDVPARQSFVIEMVGREDLTNAIALNSSMFNLAVVIGPAIGGLTYALVGPAWCFALNGLSFLAVIVALLLMRLQPTVAPPRTTGALNEMREGLHYAMTHRMIRTLIMVAAVMSLFGMSFMTLAPAWAVTVLGGDATTNGWLQSARGLGALTGAIFIATLGQFRGKGRLLTLGTFVFPLMLLVFAQVRWLPLSLLAVAATGWGFMVLFNMENSLIQTLVPDQLRGRVISIYTLSFFGLAPLGALAAGWGAEFIGEPVTVSLSGLVCLGFAAWIWLRVPELRRLE